MTHLRPHGAISNIVLWYILVIVNYKAPYHSDKSVNMCFMSGHTYFFYYLPCLTQVIPLPDNPSGQSPHVNEVGLWAWHCTSGKQGLLSQGLLDTEHSSPVKLGLNNNIPLYRFFSTISCLSHLIRNQMITLISTTYDQSLQFYKASLWLPRSWSTLEGTLLW